MALDATEIADHELLDAAATALGITLTATQVGQIRRFRTLLLDWNTRMNLTAITAPDAVLTRHMIDALTCLIACDLPLPGTPVQVLDVGSGAGFPGLVLAIARPDWQIASLEATLKKVHFQEAVIADLNLTNARVTHGRAEVVAHDAAWRGRASIVTARALATLPTLLEWCAPFAAVGGIVIAPKKGDLATELTHGSRAAQILGGGAIERLPLPPALTTLVPDLDDGRVIVRVRQRRLAPPAYPRAAGAPSKAPLGTDPPATDV